MSSIEQRLEYLEEANEMVRMQNRVLATALKTLINTLSSDTAADVVESIQLAFEDELAELSYEDSPLVDLFHDVTYEFFAKSDVRSYLKALFWRFYAIICVKLTLKMVGACDDEKWIATALACSVFALSACGGQQQESTQNAASERLYTVAMNAEFAPFEFMDANNNIEGFDVDLMNAMAKAGNFNVKYKHQPWDSLFSALNNGDVDILASAVTITDERKQTMLFSAPYFEVTQVILVPKNKAIKSIADLKTMQKVGVVTGNTGDLAAAKILGTTSDKIARYDNLPLMLKEVETGGVDAAISDSSVISNYIKNNGDKGFTMVAVPDFEVENYGFVVQKDNVATQTMLNEALAKVRESGEYEQISSKYFAK